MVLEVCDGLPNAKGFCVRFIKMDLVQEQFSRSLFYDGE